MKSRRLAYRTGGIVLALPVLAYVVFFSVISMHDHLFFGRMDTVIGQLARIHLRYMRQFDTEQRNAVGETLLQQVLASLALSQRESPEKRAALVELVRVLRMRGANINAHNPQGQTLLMDAIYNRNVDAARILVDFGADPLAQGKGDYRDQSAQLIFDRQVTADVDFLRRLLRCDSAALAESTYDAMILGRFVHAAMRFDRKNCTPRSPDQIGAFFDKYRRVIFQYALREKLTRGH